MGMEDGRLKETPPPLTHRGKRTGLDSAEQKPIPVPSAGTRLCVHICSCPAQRGIWT